jgi:cold shock CspA family protein
MCKLIGKVNRWIEPKNFGFIHENRDGLLVVHFLHRKNVIDGVPREGDTVRFTSEQSEKGLVAKNVEIISTGGAQ